MCKPSKSSKASHSYHKSIQQAFLNDGVPIAGSTQVENEADLDYREYGKGLSSKPFIRHEGKTTGKIAYSIPKTMSVVQSMNKIKDTNEQLYKVADSNTKS